MCALDDPTALSRRRGLVAHGNLCEFRCRHTRSTLGATTVGMRRSASDTEWAGTSWYLTCSCRPIGGCFASTQIGLPRRLAPRSALLTTGSPRIITPDNDQNPTPLHFHVTVRRTIDTGHYPFLTHWRGRNSGATGEVGCAASPIRGTGNVRRRFQASRGRGAYACASPGR
jgi:hypothetical protein